MVEMTRVATVVEATSQPMPRRDPLRKYMDIIYREVGTATKPCKNYALHFQSSTSWAMHWRKSTHSMYCITMKCEFL